MYHVPWSTLNDSIARVGTWIKITSSWDYCVVGPSVACRSTPQAPIHRHPGGSPDTRGSPGTHFFSHLDPRSLQLALSFVIVHLCMSCADVLRRQHTTLGLVATLLPELCETETATAIHGPAAILGRDDFAPATAAREIARRRHGREQQDHDYRVRRRRMRYARNHGDLSSIRLIGAQERVPLHCAWYAVNGRPTMTQPLVRALLQLRPRTAS
jgi:hypothetical protein